MFGKLAEVAGEYLRKGAQVYIEGQLRTAMAGRCRSHALRHRGAGRAERHPPQMLGGRREIRVP